MGTGFVVLFVASVSLVQDREPETIPGIGEVGPIERVATGFVFTEGPAADGEGNLSFTDVRANTIYRLGPDGEVSAFLTDSEGCNGLMFDAAGKLIACQGGAGRVIAIDPESKEITVLADSFEGRPFERPNDLVIDGMGGVYFTDPSAGAVYSIAAGGAVTRVLADLPRPNGVLLAPDERTLYVLPSGSPEVIACPIRAPGEVGPPQVLCRLEQAEGGPERGGDGLTVDTDGNLYLTQPGLSAIQVVSPDGDTLGLIRLPEAPSNCTFGGPDRSTLYVTARTSVYAVPTEATGHRFASGD